MAVGVADITLRGVLDSISPTLGAAIDLEDDAHSTFQRVTLPLMVPAFFSGLIYSFVRAMTAISAVNLNVVMQFKQKKAGYVTGF